MFRRGDERALQRRGVEIAELAFSFWIAGAHSDAPRRRRCLLEIHGEGVLRESEVTADQTWLIGQPLSGTPSDF
jgi:hypothetical protein